MESRALIIAIQDYSQSQGLFSQTLAGTIASAQNFYQWLVSEKKIKPECIFLCSDGTISNTHPRTRSNRAGVANAVQLVRGASRPEIVAAVLDLIDLGQDDTNELFVFFSGHGFGYRQSPWRMGLDVLVSGDFRNLRTGGAACVKLDELRFRLYSCLGGKDHYLFIDACRNEVDESQIQALGLGISPTSAQLGFPTTYTLYSVKYGEPAPVNPDFPAALMQGLEGQGHAKGWVQGKMFVKFDLLCDYIEDKVQPRQIDSRREGNGKGTLLQLPVPVLSRCDIVVVDGTSESVFQLEISSGPSPILTTKFSGPAFNTNLEPNDRTYTVTITDHGQDLQQFDPPTDTPLDMYSSCVLKFRHQAAGPPPPPPGSPMGNLDLIFSPGAQFGGPAPDWRIQLQNVRSGKVKKRLGSFSSKLEPGKYVATLFEDGTTAVSKTFRVKRGEKMTVDILARRSTPFQQAFLDRTLNPTGARVPDFSESLGPTVNWSPQLWLAYLGAAHIFRDRGRYHKLANIPLLPVDDLRSGDSGFLALSAIPGDTPQVALSDGRDVQWTPMQPVAGIPTLCQAGLPISKGPTLFSVKLGNHVPVSYSTCAVPDRITLFNISQDGEAPPVVQQFLLVPAHLKNQLSGDMQLHYPGTSALKIVRFLSLAQQRFAEHKSIDPEKLPVKNRPPQEILNVWRMLLGAKWIDPILGVIALYDIIRRGAAKHSPYPVQSVLRNLERFFPDIPDVSILHQLLMKNPQPTEGTPLFLEGALAVADAENVMKLSSDRLDFNSVWTSWRDAVRSVEVRRGASR
jgi:hypothetical protein